MSDASFSNVFRADLVQQELEVSQNQTTSNQVQQLLQKESWHITDFPKLISPAAREYLEPMAQLSQRLTRQRFGRTMQIYAPLYLSNYCQNICVYCGFNASLESKRKKLSDAEILQEAKHLQKKGFQHILLLTGEAPAQADVAYLENALRLLKPSFASLSLEVMPLATPEYAQLLHAGAHNLTIYQETYQPEYYQQYHLAGKKRDFGYRLDTPDRAGQAGFYGINIGALLGLYDWRYEAIALAWHLHYLQKKYWQTKWSLSLPRIQKISGDFFTPFPVHDADICQLLCALRLVFPDAGLTLSTREPAAFRDHLINLGVTSLSAESQTAPGGYTDASAQEQFTISDTRSLQEIKDLLTKHNLEPVFKDWDPTLTLI